MIEADPAGAAKTAVVNNESQANTITMDTSNVKTVGHLLRKVSYHGKVALAIGSGKNPSGIYLQMPRWWSSRVWEFFTTPSPIGGGFQYRVYNVRPRDSELFVCIRAGDEARVKQMLDNGEASYLDVNEYGESLLYVSNTSTSHNRSR